MYLNSKKITLVSMFRYYDIHTHHAPTGKADQMAILNFYCHFERVKDGFPCSTGLHPWHIDHYAWDREMLLKYVLQPNVLAIGECGLDKVCATDWGLQVVAFTQQIGLAHECLKPLIIHCVRAFDEVMQLLDQIKPAVPVIFHGFNKNRDVADKLLGRGYYLSFGSAMLNDHSPAAEVLATIPADQFFLETDDAQVSIEQIYDRVALIRKTSLETVVLQVQENFNRLFSHP